MNIVESDKVNIDNSCNICKDKTIKKLSSKNSNKVARYPTSKARLVFTQSKKAFIKALIF